MLSDCQNQSQFWIWRDMLLFFSLWGLELLITVIWRFSLSNSVFSHFSSFWKSVSPWVEHLGPAHRGASATEWSMHRPHGAQHCAPAWGWLFYASQVWGVMGTGGLSLSLVPTKDHSFGLFLVKWKLFTSHTSLHLAHLPRLPWKWKWVFLKHSCTVVARERGRN